MSKTITQMLADARVEQAQAEQIERERPVSEDPRQWTAADVAKLKADGSFYNRVKAWDRESRDENRAKAFRPRK